MEDNKGMMMDMDSAMNYLQNNMERIKSDYLAETYAEYKAANEKFLADNKTKEGVRSLRGACSTRCSWKARAKCLLPIPA